MASPVIFTRTLNGRNVFHYISIICILLICGFQKDAMIASQNTTATMPATLNTTGASSDSLNTTETYYVFTLQVNAMDNTTETTVLNQLQTVLNYSGCNFSLSLSNNCIPFMIYPVQCNFTGNTSFSNCTAVISMKNENSTCIIEGLLNNSENNTLQFTHIGGVRLATPCIQNAKINETDIITSFFNPSNNCNSNGTDTGNVSYSFSDPQNCTGTSATGQSFPTAGATTKGPVVVTGGSLSFTTKIPGNGNAGQKSTLKANVTQPAITITANATQPAITITGSLSENFTSGFFYFVSIFVNTTNISTFPFTLMSSDLMCINNLSTQNDLSTASNCSLKCLNETPSEQNNSSSYQTCTILLKATRMNNACLILEGFRNNSKGVNISILDASSCNYTYSFTAPVPTSYQEFLNFSMELNKTCQNNASASLTTANIQDCYSTTTGNQTSCGNCSSVCHYKSLTLLNLTAKPNAAEEDILKELNDTLSKINGNATSQNISQNIYSLACPVRNQSGINCTAVVVLPTTTNYKFSVISITSINIMSVGTCIPDNHTQGLLNYTWSSSSSNGPNICSGNACNPGLITLFSLNGAPLPVPPTPLVITSVNGQNTTSISGNSAEEENVLGLIQNFDPSNPELLLNALDGLLNQPSITVRTAGVVVSAVGTMLNSSAPKVVSYSTRITQMVDKVGLKLNLTEDFVNLTSSTSLAVAVKKANGNNFTELVFSVEDPDNLQVTLGSSQSLFDGGSVTFPASLLSNVSQGNRELVSKVQFNFFKKTFVFQDNSRANFSLNSFVVGANVPNISLTNLKDNVTVLFKNINETKNNDTVLCVFWNYSKFMNKGGWDETGCSVKNKTASSTICQCNHLTSFAVLLGSSLNYQPNIVLTYITFVGCGISCIFLAVTILTYLLFEKLRKDYPAKILIQLCLALLGLNLVFLIDSWIAIYKDVPGLCIAVAVFLHYFLLASFTWMGLEAFHMYLALVKVFNTYVQRYMLKFCIVGWGLPAVVIAIVVGISRGNYGLATYSKSSDGYTDEFCWIKNDTAFYVSVVAYFCVVFLINLGMFIVVLVQLCRIKNQKHNHLKRNTFRDMKSVAGLTFLLGITWGFALFAWGDANLPFMYLFTIFNTLQGFFIFIFHCATKENVQKQWRRYLCCGKLRLAETSDWSRTATNYTKKQSVRHPITSFSSNSSSLNSHPTSSGSSTYLVNNEYGANSNGIPYNDSGVQAPSTPTDDVVLNETYYKKLQLGLKEENGYKTPSISLRRTSKKRGSVTYSDDM
ncbi:adhesion G-protein coupled receptor G2 isoform X2 [Polypterus senegalus]|uniref:adhesion G-protein coupled receptor G2 isoform X2 n=1 Tax=Polypterus senegalus TaxID=55291 RepID=UPI001963E2FD|nr:adhesion G-protein coupled receptor G2 isoform X2 [Polypterus senegalus]